MTDEIILKTLSAGSNIPFVDEDGPPLAVDHHRARPSLARRELPKEVASPGLSSRNASSFTTFRSVVQPRVSQEGEGSPAMLQKGAIFGQKDSLQHRYARQASASKRSKSEAAEAGSENPLQRYENAVLKYQKVRPKRQASRDRQQQQQSHGYSSSDESVARNKSKSISSIDTQSVNNILDEYEDLDYRRSSDLSDIGSISVSNFEAVMMDQQKKQDRPRVPGTRMQPKCSPVREKAQPVLKVNQQTQVRQRSRERQKESVKHVPASPTEDNPSSRVSPVTLTVDASRSKVPEVLLRKGEVQKRVDEWLSQTQSQNFPSSTREKPLTRSNSSADQKSQRRYRQDSRSRSIDEGRDKLNGTSSSYDDLSRADKKLERKLDKVNVGVNTSRGTYKEYLALKSRNKQQDYGFSASSSAVGRSRDISPSTGSRIPQRGPLSSSFRSRRLECGNEEGQADGAGESAQLGHSEKNCRGKAAAESRLTNLVRPRNESDHGRISGVSGVATGSSTPTGSSSSLPSTSPSPSVIPCRRSSFKRSPNHDQSASGGTRPLVKEETGQRARGGSSGPKGPSNFGDQGEPISPNKDGESRRPALTGDSPRAGDKAADAACKSMEASRSGDRPTRDAQRISGESTESRHHRQDNRENRMEQARQDAAYGGVGARVRTIQGQQESRVTRPRNLQVGSLPPEARKPPVLPRKEPSAYCPQDAKGERLSSPQSSFKPNNRVYAALQQLNEQNSAKSRASSANEAPSRSHYSSPNHVEKIYERSLQPQVIHADDLESVLRPSLQVSAYGEAGTGRSDLKSPSKEAVTLGERNEGEAQQPGQEEEAYERVGEPRYEHLETIEEDDQRSEASICRYPEIGLSQCLKIQQALPNGRPRCPSERKRDHETSGRRDQPNEPARTFVTFHSAGSPQNAKSGQQQGRSAATGSSVCNEHEEKRDVAEPIMILEDFQIPYDSGNLMDGSQPCHTRENSNLSTATIPLDELESERQAGKFKVEDACLRLSEVSDRAMEARYQVDQAEATRRADNPAENERTNSREIEDRVVNEVLVKNLQFKQDLPRDTSEHGDALRIIEHVGQQRPIVFHNVLCDNYENLQDARFKETKVYVTKEEMERQRLMDLLRKGDYESARAYLNNSRDYLRIGKPKRHLSKSCVDPWRRTPTTSTGIDSSITDEIWTSANEAKFFRTSTTSTGIGSSLNLHENNRSLESRDGDFYSTDIEDSKDTYRRFYPNTPTTSGLGSSSDRQSVETQRGSKDLPDHLWAATIEDRFSRFNAIKSLQTITRQPRPNHDWVKTERISRFTKHRTISQSPKQEEEIWTSELSENNVSTYATQRVTGPHKCHHQARRSFSTSIVADLAVTPDGSQQSLGSGEFLELERSYTLSTPGGSSPVCCPPCSPPPAPAAYISSARASSRRLGAGSGIGGPPSPERDPLGRLLRFLKTFYRELGTRDPPHLPAWASPLPLGTLCPAHFQPHLQLLHKGEQEHRLENIKPDQIFAPVRLSDGTVSEAPRRVAIEGGPGSGRTTLCLRLLHQWAIQGDGPALALIVPLRELRGSPVMNYLARELFPRTAAIGDAVAQVWRTLHLMEDRVLFVLDGYDECVGGRASLGDAVDLLEGRLFPDARILVTCSPSNSVALSPLVQRRIHLTGLEWPHVERLCVAYFIHNDIAEKACEFLEALNVQPQTVKQLGQHPLGWIMLCCLYQDSGSLPTETSALVQAAVKCIVKRSLDPPVPYNEEIPGHCRKRLEDFGKLSLAALREGRCCYTEAELRARGGGIEVTRLGLLTKGLTFGQRRKPDLYTPVHMAVAEFLAAYYLTSVAQYANILRRELEGLPSGIISHLAGLLGPKTHLILNQLCPLEVPPRTVFSLLKAAGASDGNISAVCRLVGAGPGFGPAPNERPPAPLVHTSPLELEGWARILESPACTLEALEVVFQVERGSDPRYLDDFFEALAGNESVKLVRITSLLGQEFPADEAQRLAGHLKSVLGKKKLNDFELVITCLEEAAHDRLECVVNALCRGLSHASSSLARLVLDMNLSGEQVSRVCDALRGCVQVQALHLPHLGCGCEGLASVAELLKERPLLALNLAGSWGAKNEDPSSSGISMGSGSGSGSGSSGCASSTLGTLPLNRCYSSLPRGALAAYGSLTRPATLPRLPLGLGLGPAPATGNGPLPQNDRDRDSNGSSKRNSDSVLCHRLPLLHPLPTCDVSSHQGTGFHEIFNAIREPNCKLRSLNVSKCLLGGLDAGCLGETIRRARNLDALRAAGASRPADVMPLVLALTEAPCLQLLDLASPRLALDDHPSRLLCHALARNTTLKLLSLEGWTFRIEESDSLAVFSELLRYTSVRELSLCNARLHLAVHEGPLARLGRRDDAGAELLRAAPPPACPAIVFLRLAGFQVTVNDRLALRGPLLLPFLAGFTALSELDLSLDKSTIGGSSGSLLFIDDKILQQFFSCLSSHFRNLQSLRINFWRVTLEDSEKTMRQIAKYVKLCNLSFLKANGLIVTDSAKKVQMEHVFVQTILTHLQYLTWLCLDGVELREAQASSIGKCVRDRYPGTSLEISAKDVHVKSVKALVAAIEDGGRAEVVYTGGSNCRLKITKIQKNGKGKKK